MKLYKNVNLYINRYGYIFPSCKTYKDKPICSIRDDLKILFSHFCGKKIFNTVTIEFSSICHANCVYCFQKDGCYKKCDFFDELDIFFSIFETKEIYFSGGEILDQKDTISYIKKLRIKKSKTLFHLKTNGNFDDKNLINFVCNNFDSVVITFNGFSSKSTKLLMGNNIDVDKTKFFVKELVSSGKINVGIKYLLSPVSVLEINDFTRWAIETKPLSIIYQVAYFYDLKNEGISTRGNTLIDRKSFYWFSVLNKIGEEFKTILKERINKDVTFLNGDKEFIELFDLNDDKMLYNIRTDGFYTLKREDK